MWNDEPELYPPPSVIRHEVLTQHERLRALLKDVIEHAATSLAAGADQPRAHERLVEALRVLRLRFEEHLRFEELALLPLLAAADHWGPERAWSLHEDHEQQRRELEELTRGLDEGWSPQQVTTALQTLASDLLHDMEEEERDYLSAETLDDAVARATPGARP